MQSLISEATSATWQKYWTHHVPFINVLPWKYVFGIRLILTNYFLSDFLCLKKPCISSCDKCPVSFCSNAHRVLHQDDNGQCFPYQIENRPGIGRVLIATRTIKPMELILMDPGTVIGPNYTSKPTCLECLRPVNGCVLCKNCFLKSTKLRFIN